MINNSCAIISEPPTCFPWGFDEEDEGCDALKLLLLHRLSYLQIEGVTRFFVSIDSGIGLYASEIILSLMTSNNAIQLFTIIPYEEQAVKWSPELRDRYFAVLENSSGSSTASKEYTNVCELDATLEAIDNAGTVLVVCAKKYPQDKTCATAIRYAIRCGKAVQTITPMELY